MSSSSTPAAAQAAAAPKKVEPTQSDAPRELKEIVEGLARIEYNAKDNEVFYNPVQVLNRDLSVAMLRWFARTREEEKNARDAKKQARADAAGREWAPTPQRKMRVLEALSATGLRSVRYAKEVPGIGEIVANDLDPAAVETIRANVVANGLDPETQVRPNHGDAITVMANSRSGDERFDVVDLDPYGSASMFLDGAVQCVSNGGLLCITCTDGPVLCGNHPEVCFAKYGSIPYKHSAMHEAAVRMILYALQTSATRYGRHVEPVLSIAVDFYFRVFVRVHDRKLPTKLAATRVSHVAVSPATGSLYFQPVGVPGEKKKKDMAVAPRLVLPAVCPETGERMKMIGPLFTAPTHDVAVVESVIADIGANKETMASHARLLGKLHAMRLELPDVPLSVTIADMCSTLRTACIDNGLFFGALKQLGFRYSGTHAKKTGVKTDAPPAVLWDLVRQWARGRPRSPHLDARGAKMLEKEVETVIDWAAVKREVKFRDSKDYVPRFLDNPEKYWGPKKAAVGKKRAAEDDAEGAGASDDAKKPRAE